MGLGRQPLQRSPKLWIQPVLTAVALLGQLGPGGLCRDIP